MSLPTLTQARSRLALLYREAAAASDEDLFVARCDLAVAKVVKQIEALQHPLREDQATALVVLIRERCATT